MKKMLVILASTCQLAACEMNPAYDEGWLPPPPENVRPQVAVLSTWKPGMTLAGMDADISWQLEEVKQEREADGDWQFYYALNPATYARFGMLFHDGILVSLVSAEDGDHLLDCLNPYNLDGRSWLTYGLSAYGPWVQSRSILGDPQALAETGTQYGYVHDSPADRKYRDTHPRSGEVLTLVVLAPFLVLMLPALLGGADRDMTAYVDQQKPPKPFGLGDAPPLIQGMPHDQYDVDGIHVKIEDGGLAYGVRDGKVVMIENPSEYLWGKPPRHPVDGITRDDCPVLRSH